MREIFSRTAALDLTRIRTSAVNTNFGARLFEIRALFLFPKALCDFYAEPGCDRQKDHARRNNTYRIQNDIFVDGKSVIHESQDAYNQSKKRNTVDHGKQGLEDLPVLFGSAFSGIIGCTSLARQ